MIWPIAGRGRPRKRYIPDILSMAAEDMLANAKSRAISWRTGTKGKLKARFAAVRVRLADGPPQRIRDKGQQHLPGDEAWLIGEHRISGEKKYYLANLPAKMDPRTLASVIKARWICEQAHQQLKEELGLDHFEGRSWQGLHRHALMTMIAYAFLQYRRLKTARREKKINGPPPQPTLPAVRQAILELIARPPPQRCPHCRKWICAPARHRRARPSHRRQGRSGIGFLDLTPEIVDERCETGVIRCNACQLLRVMQCGGEISGIAAEADERQQRVAVAGMPGQALLENRHGIVNLPG